MDMDTVDERMARVAAGAALTGLACGLYSRIYCGGAAVAAGAGRYAAAPDLEAFADARATLEKDLARLTSQDRRRHPP